MASPTEYYVDPSIAANSGSGTIGSPYGDLQHALNTITRDSTNGDRINIKAGTAELPSTTLSFATYGTPTQDAPLVLQGYTSAAGDGGQAKIDGGGGSFHLTTIPVYTHFVDIWLTNIASTFQLISGFGGHNKLVRCEFSHAVGASNFMLASATSTATFRECYFHDGGSSTIGIQGGPVVEFCYFAGAWQRCIDLNTNGTGIARNNICSITGASIGIYSRDRSHVIEHNSILSAGGTGSGIELTSASDHGIIANNIIEGFSGTGGCGLKFASGGKVAMLVGNAYYNNATHESGVSGAVNALDASPDNETLSGTGFSKSGSDTFANRGTYFEPLAVGNVRGGSKPTVLRLDKGAVQHSDPAGGGGGGGFCPVGVHGPVIKAA